MTVLTYEDALEMRDTAANGRLYGKYLLADIDSSFRVLGGDPRVQEIRGTLSPRQYARAFASAMGRYAAFTGVPLLEGDPAALMDDKALRHKLDASFTSRFRQRVRDASAVYVSNATLQRALLDPTPKSEDITPSKVAFDPGFYVFANTQVVKGPRVEGVAEDISDLPIHAAYIEHHDIGQDGVHKWFFALMRDWRRISRDGLLPEDSDFIDAVIARYGPMTVENFGVFSNVMQDMSVIDVDVHTLLKVITSMGRTDDDKIAVVQHGDRRVRRRGERAGVKDPGIVNVLYHHTSEHRKMFGKGSGAKLTAHSVRGHWRRQPFGPREAEPRPWRWTYIDAHQRGSKAAPETTRERIHKA